ncbi:MAG: hypothetical protein PHR77_01685 [Kiritimatiellae bacterium]|nr:hypothetical protein [Kiritimatiellia bacterium]MDD5521918.1 hypothetical protein [Kiritimatiellia bacterium]
MKKVVFLCFILVLPVVLLLGMSLLTGCESAEGTEGLQVEPSSITLTPSSNTVTFTAILNVTNALSLPITWSLKDSSLGSIIGSSGSTAIYQRSSRNGDNVITARDQYGNEGFAAINQISETYVLTVTASATVLSSGTNACTVTASGGIAPYRWSVGNPSLGSVSGTGSSVMYQSSQAGSNVITVRDGNGVSASIAITRTAS